MSRRFLPVVLVLAALLSDLGGAHDLALSFLFFAVPAAFVLALDWYGDCLEARCSLIRPVLGGFSVAALVLSASLRSLAVGGGVPAFAVSALVVVLLLYGTVGLAALLPAARTVPESA